MAISDAEREFAAHITDILQTMGPVSNRRMFGGFGIFLEGLMFGLIADNVLYFKVDDENRADFEELDLPPFSYQKQGKSMQLSYYQAPEESMEDTEVLAVWGNSAYAAAMRAARSSKPKSR